MIRALTLAAVAVSFAAFAESPRIAAHPLEVRELTVEQREQLKAFYDVRLARMPNIELAGGTRVEDALRSPKAENCDTKNACLRHLANATGSLYAVHSRIRREPIDSELLMTARVVRADGVVVKTVSRRTRPEKNVDLVVTCKALVGQVLDGLELASLPARMPPQAEWVALPEAPPLVAASVARPDWTPRQKTGVAVAAVGATAIATGVVLFAASNQRDGSPEGTAGIVLIPVGAVVGLGGALLALWPEASVGRF